MAPEQARGDKDVDARARSVFAWLRVVSAVRAGDVPFKGETTMGILLALAVNDPVPLRQINGHIPPSLANLIMQMLAKDPQKRPAKRE